MMKIKDETLKNNLLEMINKIPTMSNETLQYDLEWYSELMNQTNKDTELYQGYNLYINEIKKYLNGNTRVNDVKEESQEEVKENKNDEAILDEYEKVVWDVCMNTESKYLSNKNIDYKWYGLFNVNSKSKNENTPKEDGSTYGCVEAEEHRFIYENYIRSSIKLLEEMSDSGRKSVMSNIKKLAKISNGLVTIDTTDNGETVYKIHNKTSYNKETHQFNNYVLIPSDVLKLLVCATNSNTVKIYCVLLYKCNCKDWATISNEYFHKVLGITSRTTIKKCCDLLILMGLIERTTIVDTSQKDVNGKILTKEYNQYKLRPYSEFRKRYNDLCCNKRNMK